MYDFQVEAKIPDVVIEALPAATATITA